ncbi:MAG: hypothetical protein JWM04_196 [Verrucomicrobiales bacterium]|nr:hypothetical protein [Verrucomicrobiales bacterium]
MCMKALILLGDLGFLKFGCGKESEKSFGFGGGGREAGGLGKCNSLMGGFGLLALEGKQFPVLY